MRRRMKRTLRTGKVGMVMHARHEFMSGGIVMILAFQVCQVVLRCLGGGADPASDISLLSV